MRRQIHVKHFQVGRKDEIPVWTVAEEFLSKIEPEDIITVNVYPTGPSHNLVVVYKQLYEVESGTRIPESP